METTNFNDDIKKGDVGIKIFKEDYLDFLGIKYNDVQNVHQFQMIDTDLVISVAGKYEVKNNYKDDGFIIIEEYTNYESDESKKDGWFYKTEADVIVFVSGKSRTMILLPFTESFKEYYKNIKRWECILIINRPSVRDDGRTWCSAFRSIPLERIKGFYSIYKK